MCIRSVHLKISNTKIIVAVVLAFLAIDLWYAFVHLPAKAEAEWQAVREELIAKGEKLSIADYVPEKVPDERNFFADPLWAELHDREPVTKDGMTYHKNRKPEGEWKISVLKKPFDAAERKSLEEEFPAFAPLDGQKDKLTALRKHWGAAKKSGDTAQAAKFVLRGLESGEPIVARFRELGQRPDAFFPLVYEDGPGMSLEHVAFILYVNQRLHLHASALLTQGRSDEAFRDVKLMFRLAKALEPEHTFIVVLVDMTGVALAASVIRQGIKVHAWSEVELVEFERELARIDIPARLAGGLRADRASWLDTVMPLVKKNGMSLLEGMTAPDEANQDRGYKDALARPAIWFYCTYWMPGDKIFYAQSIQKWVEALDRVPSEGMREEFFPNFPKEYVEENPEGDRSGMAKLRRIVSMLSLPALTGTFRNAARKQTEITQARVAVALERHWMKHGQYPEKIDALVPEFLSALPLDLVTMEPFLYRREEPGKFVLWSVGWDEIDEEGTPGKKDDEGDWVWEK